MLVAQLSQSEILPKVKHMDEFGELDQQVLRSLFKSGVNLDLSLLYSVQSNL